MRKLMFFLLAFFVVFTCIRAFEKPDNSQTAKVMSVKAQVPAVQIQAEIPVEIVN